MRHNGERRPEEIEAEIARTRTDMDATLTAIEQRLTPGQLIDQGLDYLRHSGGREFVSNLGGSVKNNPLPVALMGIGMAWLMATGNRRPEERLAEGMSSTRQRLSQTGQSARERIGQWGETARGGMQRVRGGYDSIVREQPLVLGAIGLAVGALLGAGLPRTREEDRLMGEASDRLTEKARDVGREQVEKAKEAASAAKDTVMKEAGKQGAPQPSRPAGRPNVVEPARAAPVTESARPRDPRAGKP
jgi:ElaB/YqjD/DUF883 family membrane-anchored ribosome-binding protein